MLWLSGATVPYSDKGAQRAVYGLRIWELFGHVWFQYNDIRALMIAFGVLAPHTLGKIVFFEHFFVRRLLHIVSSLFSSLAER